MLERLTPEEGRTLARPTVEPVEGQGAEAAAQEPEEGRAAAGRAEPQATEAARVSAAGLLLRPMEVLPSCL